jgi:hypothetical protein
MKKATLTSLDHAPGLMPESLHSLSQMKLDYQPTSRTTQTYAPGTIVIWHTVKPLALDPRKRITRYCASFASTSIENKSVEVKLLVSH